MIARIAHSQLGSLYSGSGGQIPAIWHGAGACHGILTPETLYPERGDLRLCRPRRVQERPRPLDTTPWRCSVAMGDRVSEWRRLGWPGDVFPTVLDARL